MPPWTQLLESGNWTQPIPTMLLSKTLRHFVLEEEAIVPPGWTGRNWLQQNAPIMSNSVQGCWSFGEMAEKYEMHIYTMATRNYALSIAKIIDPDGKYFGDRILSRDESGSLTHKNLKRLFPVDQSMVVIIDDRGDVWQWESNLIKVVPMISLLVLETSIRVSYRRKWSINRTNQKEIYSQIRSCC